MGEPKGEDLEVVGGFGEQGELAAESVDWRH